MTKKVLLQKVIEDKTIVWFENRNEYVIFENTTADILKRINKGMIKIQSRIIFVLCVCVLASGAGGPP